jgi:hypothetical protein
MSVDKLGLGKLLGSGSSDTESRPPPVSPSASAANAVRQQQQGVKTVKEASSGGSSVSERSKPPTAGPKKPSGGVSGALPALKNRLSGRLSRKQSADVTSVGSEKSIREKENLQQTMFQQQVQQQKGEEDTTKKRRKTLSLMIDPLNK